MNINKKNIIISKNWYLYLEFTHSTKASYHYLFEGLGTGILRAYIDPSDRLTVVSGTTQISNQQLISGNKYKLLLNSLGSTKRTFLYDSNNKPIRLGSGSSSINISRIQLGARTATSAYYNGLMHTFMLNYSDYINYPGMRIPQLD